MVAEQFGKPFGSGARFWNNLHRTDDLETVGRTA